MGKRWTCSLPMLAVARLHRLEVSLKSKYDATFTTNVKGTLFTVQKSLPHLNDGSSIILNASIASVKGIPGLSVYSAARLR